MKKQIVMVLISTLIIGGSNLSLPGNVVNAEQLDEVEKKEESLVFTTEEKNKGEESVAEGTEEIQKDIDEDILNTEEKELEVISDHSDMLEASEVEMTVPIYNYEIDNVIVPTTYAMSLNPYGLPIVVDEDNVSTEQVVSKEYGIINKSSTDKIVTITLTVEDLNNEITFVDSEEEVKNSDEETYAVYLSVIPSDGKEIKIDGVEADTDTSASALSDVDMSGAKEQAVALHAGENHIAFRLSRATYNLDNISLSKEKPTAEDVLDLIGLSPDGGSVTAFTFGGAMNPKADWEKLSKGIKVSAAYDYQTADGTEKIINGTGSLIAID